MSPSDGTGGSAGSTFMTGSGGAIVSDSGGGVQPGPLPTNIGTEQNCDGVDENQNGIIDDVDVAKDGLCDCLKIAFLGEISGESGQTTGSFGDWLNARSNVPVRMIGADQPITADTLGDLQVLVIGNLVSRTYSGQAPYYPSVDVDALHQWIAEGGGVMALAGYTSSATAAVPTNDLLGPTGIQYDLMTYPDSGYWTMPNTTLGTSYVITQFAVHPTTDGVTALGVFHGYPVLGDGTVIATDSNLNVGMAKELDRGHVFVWADEWITNDSEWIMRTDLQVARFWLNTIRWLTPANECQVPIPDVIR
jgi:hypothetical protein